MNDALFIPGGKLLDNLIEFGALLRRAGMPVGTDRALAAVRAAQAVGIRLRDDLLAALRSVYVQRQEQLALFEEAFELFFRDVGDHPGMIADRLNESRFDAKTRRRQPTRRLTDAYRWIQEQQARSTQAEKREDEHVADRTMTFSADETLRARDFEQMSAEELRRAQEAIGSLQLPVRPRRTRRLRADSKGNRVDLRAILRAGIASGGTHWPMRWRAPSYRMPPVVVLCDVSGSMDRYARVLLHFMHALSQSSRMRNPFRVDAFLFGTRLTHVTRALRFRDIDRALLEIGQDVQDWGGGTRIASCVAEFNLRWARRVLGQGAIVLLVTDGLERDTEHHHDRLRLDREVARLRRSSRRLIWLNPLLRYDNFEPLAQGVRAILPNVDEMRPVHNLVSLEELVEALGAGRRRPSAMFNRQIVR